MKLATFEARFAPYIAFGWRNLATVSPNRFGTDVAILQALYNLLIDLVDPTGGTIGTAIAVDGVFGAKTRIAVLSVQNYFGLTADGIAGPQTFAALGQPVHAGGQVQYGRRALAQGSVGEDVKALQSRLNCFGYAQLLGRPADGRFDAETASALRRFQTDAAEREQAGLRPTGRAKAATFDATWLYLPLGGRALGIGRNGLDVAFLQAHLRRLGLFKDRVDGYFGQATRAAVQRLQTASALPADGIAESRTFYALGLQLGEPSLHPAPIDR